MVQAELAHVLKDYVGRETPLYHAERLSEHYRRCCTMATCLLLPAPLTCPASSSRVDKLGAILRTPH